MPPLLLLSDYGVAMMTETTISESASHEQNNVLHERSECKNIDAADIAIIVESAAKEKTPRLAPVIETKPLVAKEYVDPQEQEYIVNKQNLIGTGLDRNTDEGRSIIHQTIHIMGDLPEL